MVCLCACAIACARATECVCVRVDFLLLHLFVGFVAIRCIEMCCESYERCISFL